jgi:hypothetical protein
MLARDKHSTLLETFINYGRNFLQHCSLDSNLIPFSGQKREQDFSANFVQPLPEDQRQARRRQLHPGVNLI